MTQLTIPAETGRALARNGWTVGAGMACRRYESPLGHIMARIDAAGFYRVWQGKSILAQGQEHDTRADWRIVLAAMEANNRAWDWRDAERANLAESAAP